MSKPTLTPLPSKIQPPVTEYGQPGSLGKINWQATRKKQLYRGLILILANGLLLGTFYLATFHLKQSNLSPWLFTLLTGSLLIAGFGPSGIREKTTNTINNVDLPQAKSFAKSAYIGSQQTPVSLRPCLTYTYLCFALCTAAIFIHSLGDTTDSAAKVQNIVIDIDLTDKNDFSDSKSLLSGSAPQPKLNYDVKANAAIRKEGQLFTSPQVKESKPKASSTSQDKTEQVQPKPIAQTSATTPQNVLPAPTFTQIPSSWQTQYQAKKIILPPAANKPKTQAKPSAGSDSQYLEEVSNPELVEVLDSDANDKGKLWQPGGRSTGGSGAKSDIMTYLKEVNRKVKRAWNPPRGQPFSVEVIFRLGKNGQLLSTKIIRSSGKNDADRECLEAIVQAAPFQALPEACTLGLLDVHYTFNYKVDELTETTAQ